jgi:Acylphosphatases
MEKLVRVHIFVEGLVQGVFFRSTTRSVAKKYNIKGWVKNLPDGRVEIVAEGREEDIKKLIEFCKRGPPAAIVTDVQIFWEEYKGEFDDFEIRY